ncbi:CheY-like superfamily [Gaertneriomyces semiglobifer]|nr:CheY-like superfamily [Gaertneriomyces semiglobifer]
MSPYQLSKLFKRFSQASIRTHREYGGSGLGLHISKQMARLMDGDIWVESTEGVGSRFWVKVRCEKFPGFSAETEMATNSMEIGSPFFNTSAATIAARRMTTPPPPPTTTGGGGASSSASPASPSTYLKPDPNADRPIHILVAEDNIINQRVIKRQFEICEPRFLVTLASNGLEALEVVQKSGTAAKPISSNQEGAGDRHGHARGPVDVILMDVEMPVMDGMEATTKIRLFEQTLADSSSDVGVPVKRMPIIGLSGNAREEHRRRALEAGMDDYVVKPYERSSLVRKILEWVGR